MSLGVHTLATWKILMEDSYDTQIKLPYLKVFISCSQVIVRFIVLRYCYAVDQYNNLMVIILNNYYY